MGVQRGFLAGSNALIFQKVEKTGVRRKKETANRKNKFVQETLIQKEWASAVAAFLLLIDTAYNALKRVLIVLGEQREMHTRMEGNGISKYTCKGKDILRLQLSSLVWFFYLFLWQGEMGHSFAFCHFCKVSLWDMQVNEVEEMLSI